MTQLTLNAKLSNTTKISSFFANFEKDFNLFEFELSNKSTQSTIQKIETLKKTHENINYIRSTVLPRFRMLYFFGPSRPNEKKDSSASSAL